LFLDLLSAEAACHIGFIFEVSLLALQTKHLVTFGAHYGVKREAEAERTSEIFINFFVQNLFLSDSL
jgi:hypothetical protein